MGMIDQFKEFAGKADLDLNSSEKGGKLIKLKVKDGILCISLAFVVSL